jgi:hypothetical protein
MKSARSNLLVDSPITLQQVTHRDAAKRAF